MKLTKYLLMLLIVALPSCLLAQDDADVRIFNQAEADYNSGRVEQALHQLKNHVGGFSGELKIHAYRMMSLCSLEMGNEEEARKYAQLILMEEPFFRASERDPQRFKDLIDAGSRETATISTASSKDEALSEVPVPVTLITSEMIRDCSARNLKDVLIAYVPGMNDVDCNDDINISMRGIYSNGQEKILIMVNGHRLNSYCTNIAAPDFSISLEKVKQIEVLRGPASSLYGGVALSAVVNIITKQGGDVDGIQLKGGIGNFGQYRGDFLFGKHYADIDVLVWGSLYRSKGQNFYIPAENTGLKRYGGDITVGGIGNKPSYDLGVTVTWKNRVKFFYDTHFSQVISPFTASYGYSPYDRDRYMTFNGIGPSYATRSHHIDFSYSRNLFDDALHLQGSVTYDNSDLTHYQVISDSSFNSASILLGVPQQLDIAFSKSEGIFRYINGQENTLGAQIRGDFSYNRKNEKKEGVVTFGAQFNHFSLEDVRYLIGVEYEIALLESNTIAKLGKGTENSFNTFVQLKQRWNNFIFNAGLRFDHYRHYNEQSINELSPRLAIIYTQPKWNVKLSYSKSFVDAPYFYRKTNYYINDMKNINTLSEVQQPTNDITLLSEYLHSFQLTLASTKWVDGLDLELTGYYNRATNLIYKSVLTHENAGIMKSIGAELTGSYRKGRLAANLTVSWQHVLESEIYQRDISTAYSIPQLTVNAVLGWNVTKRLRLNTHLVVESKKSCYQVDLVKQTLVESTLDPLALLTLGARYSFGFIEIGANCHNLFNTLYYRGGFSSGLIPQQGRSFMGYVSLKF